MSAQKCPPPILQEYFLHLRSFLRLSFKQACKVLTNSPFCGWSLPKSSSFDIVQMIHSQTFITRYSRVTTEKRKGQPKNKQKNYEQCDAWVHVPCKETMGLFPLEAFWLPGKAKTDSTTLGSFFLLY